MLVAGGAVYTKRDASQSRTGKLVMHYHAFIKIIKLYLNNESGIFAFLVYIAIMDLPTIRNLQQGGV